MEFPVAKPRNIDGGRNGRLSRIEWLSMSRLQSHLGIDVIKLAVLRWVVWRVRAPRCFESPRTRVVVGVTSLVEDQCALCLAFVSFAPTPAVKANHQADGANV